LKTLILISQIYKSLLQALSALWAHIHLALRLKHNGAGLPSSMLGASLLVAIYIACSLLNATLTGQITANTLLGFCFISGGYVFYLRNQVLGLQILTSVIINVIAMLLYWRFGANELSHLMLAEVEYALVIGALLNLIKKETHAIQNY